MGISQLPKIDIPEEETLDDEEKSILDALRIIHDGYRRSQNRLRAVSKAYKQLESIALSLLNERDKNVATTKTSPKKRESPSSDKNVRKKLSPLQLHSNGSPDDDLEVLMVDLTSDFDASQRFANPAMSPVFGHHRKRSRKSSEKAEFGKNVKQVKDSDDGSSKAKETAENNEENRPPIADFNDTTLYINESQAVAKIGFSKSVYNVEAHRKSTGKRLKQSTIVFKPQTSRMDLSGSEDTFAKPEACKKLGDLFDEKYRNAKKPATKKDPEKKPEDRKIDATELEDKREKPEETPTKRRDVCLTIDTPSQIDETARSLFDDDDDIDVFNGSDDFLNTCMDSPTIVDKAIQPLTPVVKTDKRVGPIASTSKASESFQASESIDETFFAPVETKKPNRLVEQPGCSTTAIAKDSPNHSKRKSDGEAAAVEAEKESGDFGVQDIDWDQDISSDNWPPPKQTLNDSFDIIPEKKKNPNYAYKGKVVRNQAERAKLRGWSCKDCENYYGNLNLSEEELRKQMDRCSRHRSKYNQRYLTPAGFWDPLFSDSGDDN